jgi:hypothetical protein
LAGCSCCTLALRIVICVALLRTTALSWLLLSVLRRVCDTHRVASTHHSLALHTFDHCCCAHPHTATPRSTTAVPPGGAGGEEAAAAGHQGAQGAPHSRKGIKGACVRCMLGLAAAASCCYFPAPFSVALLLAQVHSSHHHRAHLPTAAHSPPIGCASRTRRRLEAPHQRMRSKPSRGLSSRRSTGRGSCR